MFHGIDARQDVDRLRKRLLAAIDGAGFSDVMAQTIRYAVRLARDESELIFEEMSKLYSLCEDVHVLEWLGFTAPDEVIADYRAAVRERFVRQHRLARGVAEDTLRPWSKTMWWYRDFAN